MTGSTSSGDTRPLVVGFGGTLRAGSSSERALRACLRAAEDAGAATRLLTADELDFPLYRPGDPGTEKSRAFADALRRSDGVIVSTPGYHGGVSGLVKNALDYVEDLRDDNRSYFQDRAVGCVACAADWQPAATTLVSLRSTVHALRGWPTPLGVAFNSSSSVFGPDGDVVDSELAAELDAVGKQVVEFAAMRVPTG